jgi:hypothetical protein
MFTSNETQVIAFDNVRKDGAMPNTVYIATRGC